MLSDNVFADYIDNKDANLFYTDNEKWLYKLDDIGLHLGYFQGVDEKIIANKELIYLINSDEVNTDIHDINIQRIKQEYQGFMVKKDIYSSDKFGFEITGKLVNGQNIDMRYYQGMMSIANTELVFKGKNQEIYSSIAEQTTMHDVDFHSRGYSLGCNMDYRINEDLKLSFNGENIISQINWYDVYVMNGTFNSDNIIVNDDGYLEYSSFIKPLLLSKQ
ncbi:MAG: hypothetical protein ACOCRZ_06750 [Halothermotrichaceae bacterium]